MVGRRAVALHRPDREYLTKTYGVTPTISELLQAYSRGGFAVTWMEEVAPEDAYAGRDMRASSFGNMFPLRHLFELSHK